MRIFPPSCIGVLAALALGCTPRAASHSGFILFPAVAGHEHVRPGESAPVLRLGAPAALPCDSVAPSASIDSIEWPRVAAPTPLPAGVSAATIRLPSTYRLDALPSRYGRSPDELAHWALPAAGDSARWLRAGSDSIRMPVVRRSIFVTLSAHPGYPQTAGHVPARETWSHECRFELAGRTAFAYFFGISDEQRAMTQYVSVYSPLADHVYVEVLGASRDSVGLSEVFRAIRTLHVEPK